MAKKLVRLINLCLEKQIPFVSYRLPDEEQTITWVQRSGGFNLVESIIEVIDLPGFIYAPFHRRTNYPVVFFEPEMIIYNDDFEKELLKSISAQKPLYRDYEVQIPENTTKEEYLRRAGKFTEGFDHSIEKAVLSRVEKVQKSKEFNAGEFFMKMQEAYPNAFCHIIHIPGTGTWAGATPESLIRIDEKTARTVSLAGTLPGEGYGEKHQWQAKEIEEQQLVNDYMEEILAAFDITQFNKTATENIQAGDLIHLINKYDFNRGYLKDKLGEFLVKLHPTPAVCGYPKQAALNLILDTEKHNREYYAGYCGPINYLGKTDLFVNLRCMKILPGQLALFVGGGLTAKSDPEKEWMETVLKSKTLLKLL